MAKKFTLFVDSLNKQSKGGKQDFNPQDRIARFVALVNSLYSNIDEWLHDYLVDGTITTGIVPTTISEEVLGPYKVDEKWIQIGRARILFEPIGTIMIGTIARIDMVYKAKRVMIVRTGENIVGPGNLISIEIDGEPPRKPIPAGKAVWKYVKDKHRISYVTLNKESFEDLIMDTINEAR